MQKEVVKWLNENPSNYTEEEQIQVVDEINKQRTLYANLGSSSFKYGYTIDDFFVACTHAGQKCGPKDFALFSHPDFFNCYTYKGGARIPTLTIPGPTKGLSLVLYGDFLQPQRLHMQYENGPLVNAQGKICQAHPVLIKKSIVGPYV